MWDYSRTEPFAYGEETTYILGMEALAGCRKIEDWGCGTAWARRYCPTTYLGVDQAPGYADVVADLRTYTSKVDGIFMRHVLEHNEEWEAILANALASAQRTLVVILFTPMAPETHVRQRYQDIPDISFCAFDLEQRFGNHPVRSTDVATATQYGKERVYVVDMTKPKAEPKWKAKLASR